MYLRSLLKNLQAGTRIAQAAVGTSKRTMQTNYGDYVRFLELVGNVKVSEEKSKISRNFSFIDLDRKKNVKKENFSRSLWHMWWRHWKTHDSWNEPQIVSGCEIAGSECFVSCFFDVEKSAPCPSFTAVLHHVMQSDTFLLFLSLL